MFSLTQDTKSTSKQPVALADSEVQQQLQANESIFFYPASNHILRRKFTKSSSLKASSILKKESETLLKKFDSVSTLSLNRQPSEASLTSPSFKWRSSSPANNTFQSTSDIFIGSRTTPSSTVVELKFDSKAARLPPLFSTTCVLSSRPPAKPIGHTANLKQASKLQALSVPNLLALSPKHK